MNAPVADQAAEPPGRAAGADIRSPGTAARIGLLLLAPASLIFSLRAVLGLAGTDPATVAGLGPATGIGGGLSLFGVIALLAGTWHRPQRTTVQTAAVLILVGHFVVTDLMGDMGPAMVYLGTGVAAAAWYRPAGWIGGVAALGAILRAGTPATGLTGVALGAGATGLVLLVLALLPQLVYKNRYIGCTDDAH